ncbi:MAG: HAMP domain-containing histidine kinase [Halioglobus sp.]|nr:HAMP domain-containing histidine kinase [Halioglobus sp.]
MKRFIKTKSQVFSVAQLHAIFFALCCLLTLLLYLQGGATNPFVSLYLVPIAISAATLPVHRTLSLAAFCLLAYSLLMFYYEPMQLLSPGHDMTLMSSDNHSMHISESSQVNWHVVGMWLNFVLSTVLITYFVVRMARTLRRRNAELADAREQQLRDEQLLGIATLAAGTLHELGTPLATMTLIVDELESAASEHPAIAADVALLAQQLARCKLSLQHLAHAAEQSSDQLQRVAINEYLERVMTHWHLLKPGIPLQNSIPAVDGYIRIDSTFEQAIINLLNNAAEASPDGIEIDARLDTGAGVLTLLIRDHGPGIDPDADNLGQPFVSTRGKGRGLGLFLSNATIERLGGRVMLQSHTDGGTLTTVTLPCVE